MTFKEFLQKWNISLDDPIIKLCLDGLHKMKHNPDPHHALPHIQNLFSELDVFLKKESSVSVKNIDFNVLLPSICWHDVWKGKDVQTNKFYITMYRDWAESTLSGKTFKTFVKNNYKNEISKQQVNKINHCIKKHSRLTKKFPKFFENYLFKVKYVEAKILSDIDILDSFSLVRMKQLVEHHIKSETFDFRLFIVAKWWIYLFVISAKDSNLFYAYAKNEFKSRHQNLVQEIYNFWNGLHTLLDVTDENVVKFLKLNPAYVDMNQVRDYYTEFHTPSKLIY